MLNTTECDNTVTLGNKRNTTGKVKAKLQDWVYLVVVGLVLFNLGSFLTARFNLSFPRVFAESAVTEQIIEKEIVHVEVDKKDERVIKLETFLTKEQSPLLPYAQLIVDQADEFDIGYTKLVAISCMESACARRLPPGSHNAWGLGGSNLIYFNSWEEGIKFASRLLSESYQKNEYQAIKDKYCPSSSNCNPKWVAIVTGKVKEILDK